jgi:hypothetical protein
MAGVRLRRLRKYRPVKWNLIVRRITAAKKRKTLPRKGLHMAVNPAQAGIQFLQGYFWIPACAGMTSRKVTLGSWTFITKLNL